jgi:hypothetical protein
MSADEHLAFVTIRKALSLRCKLFFKNLQKNGIVKPESNFDDCWSQYMDEDQTLEVELFDTIYKKIYFHMENHKNKDTKNKDTTRQTAYALFKEDESAIIKNENPNLSDKIINEKVREMWRKLNDSTKALYAEKVTTNQVYENMAIQTRKEYNEKVPPKNKKIDIPQPVQPPVAPKKQYINPLLFANIAESKDKESKDKESKDKESKDKESKDIESKDKESKDKESKNEGPPQCRRKKQKTSIEQLIIQVEDQYMVGDKKMFRIKKETEVIVSDVHREISKNSLPVLHLIMKKVLGGFTYVNKCKKSDAIEIVKKAIVFGE